MTASINGLNKIRSISLKWKLLIPFLFFAFTGVATLAYIGLTSQQNLIAKEERKLLSHYYHHFMWELRDKENQALSLATMIAENPQVQQLFAEKNRPALKALLDNTYERMNRDFEIDHFHFHAQPEVSFLGLPSKREGSRMPGPPNQTIRDAFNKGGPISGIEMGVAGLGIRGVVPILKDGEIIGMVEVGLSLAGDFLDELEKRLGVQISLIEKKGDASNKHVQELGSTGGTSFGEQALLKIDAGEVSVVVAPKQNPDKSFLLGPVKDGAGKVKALVEIKVDRNEIKKQLSKTTAMMIMVGLAGIAISFFLTYLVTFFFIKPIKEIVQEAQDIAAEKRESRLEPRPQDEIGTLTDALNTMLVALNRKRAEIEVHATDLEKRVKERTSELVESEEKYRTLVENVPLIVYRILRDGTTEFVNKALTESLGYSIEEAVSDKMFWREKICGMEDDPSKDVFRLCFQEGQECRIERQIKDKRGRQLTFIDHAMPAWNVSGRVKWVDGIMIDITELKRLQERALRTEEIRLLGEISARMAHEIRNPLSTAGGFARRLHDALPENTPDKKSAKIIVEQVAKLESVLKALLSSIRPFDLSLTDVDMIQLLSAWLTTLDGLLQSRKIEVVSVLPPHMPKIQGDEKRLNQALENLLRHAIVSTPEGEKFYLSVDRIEDHLEITFRHKVARLSKDDLEKFFFPHIEDWTDSTILDLPLSKIIIHRHNGKVDLIRENGNMLIMKIELPIGLTEERHP